MALPQEHISMALFCDFENVALGVRDANYDKFDIKRVLERLLLKGSIVVKKAYCDWERYKGFKAAMHEANFELIEIPHVRQSGKNSADIRLVVDALDLCYTKSHVNTFVIISGDSDFSPLVSKLRENAKYVIGVGVKQSTSDLLIANCDEFIFYDDLVRESQRAAARRDSRDQVPQQRRSPEEERRRREEMEVRRAKVVEMAAETYEALVTDRDEGGRIWASVLKEALKRRNPGFSESYYGFRTFGNLLEEAQLRGLLEFGRDEKSGTFVFRGSGIPARADALAAGALANHGHEAGMANEHMHDNNHGAATHAAPDHVGEHDASASEAAPRERTDRTERGDRSDRSRGGRSSEREASGGRGRQRGGRKPMGRGASAEAASGGAQGGRSGTSAGNASDDQAFTATSAAAPANTAHTVNMPNDTPASSSASPSASEAASMPASTATSSAESTPAKRPSRNARPRSPRKTASSGNAAVEASSATAPAQAPVKASAPASTPVAAPADNNADASTATAAKKATSRSRRPARKSAAKSTTQE